MPVHDFACPDCGQAFEELVRAGETAPCPSCGSERVERLLSQVAPPARLGLRGRAARVSDTTRANRDESRREQASVKRESRKKG